MTVHINYWQVAPDAMKTMQGVERYLRSVRGESLDPAIAELVKIRVSQLNGCAYCLDMHTKDARAQGETEQRLYVVSAWREAPFYTDKERAALEWAEALTRLNGQPLPDELLTRVRTHFNDREMSDLTLAICSINSWNRFALGLGANVGSYKVGEHG